MDTLTPEQVQSFLTEAVHRLRAEFDPLAIYFFGSLAEGRGGPGSDLDLLVIVPDSSEGAYQRTARAYRALMGLLVPTDVLVYTRSEFDARSGRRTSFERSIRERGRVVYAA